VWCDWQVTLCDPHLSALEVRFSRRCAIQIDVYLTLPYLTSGTVLSSDGVTSYSGHFLSYVPRLCKSTNGVDIRGV